MPVVTARERQYSVDHQVRNAAGFFVAWGRGLSGLRDNIRACHLLGGAILVAGSPPLSALRSTSPPTANAKAVVLNWNLGSTAITSTPIPMVGPRMY